MSAYEPYSLGPDSLPQNGVPRGEVIQDQWTSERSYPGTHRTCWIYVPKQYDGTAPACLMVFQDGGLYLSPESGITTALDNLIHKGEMPVTIGLFVNPGHSTPENPGVGRADNRSAEYDTLSDRYAAFLIDELIPVALKPYSLVDDRAGRAICGMSSGGICAFTAAWERPDYFSKVVSHCGSFTNIRGGHNYPSLIRQSDARPIRVFLQSGTHDLDVIYGNWPIANQDMAAALKFKSYDEQFVFGEGGHTLKHGVAIFPDTLRWLWRDTP